MTSLIRIQCLTWFGAAKRNGFQFRGSTTLFDLLDAIYSYQGADGQVLRGIPSPSWRLMVPASDSAEADIAMLLEDEYLPPKAREMDLGRDEDPFVEFLAHRNLTLADIFFACYEKWPGVSFQTIHLMRTSHGFKLQRDLNYSH